MLYFAYGSNLNIRQMQSRCPAAEPLGKLVLPNTRLVFRGVADVIAEKGIECQGGIWRITDECERALDRYEGFDPERPDCGMYTKEYVTVDGLPDGETEIMLYTMNSSGIFPPSVGYYKCIEEGYWDFDLDFRPLKAALGHSYQHKAPSHIERKRYRRLGRPALAPQPVSKAQRKAEKKAAKRAQFMDGDKHRKKLQHTFHDPWADVPAEQRRKKVMNLTEWLRNKHHSGERY
jgi:gamma-glutamylcyclotransferase (GGCT)/AIG2-like uncharacterized protein YtfP